MADILFHRLGRNEESRGLYELARAEGYVKILFTDDEIKAACSTPPNTRAAGRALGVHTYGFTAATEWNHISVPGEKTGLQMPDPFKTYNKEITKLARKHGRTCHS